MVKEEEELVKKELVKKEMAKKKYELTAVYQRYNEMEYTGKIFTKALNATKTNYKVGDILFGFPIVYVSKHYVIIQTPHYKRCYQFFDILKKLKDGDRYYNEISTSRIQI